MKKPNSKPLLHIAHANGFPGGSYATLAGLLSADYDVRAYDRFGHGKHAVTDNWPEVKQELIEYFESLGQPVIAVGHSFGGGLSLMVAMERPDLIKALIMLDSPMLTQVQRLGLGVIKRLGKIDRFTNGLRASNRRMHWGSEAEAQDYLASKRMFQSFDPRCLTDYVRAGTRPAEDGVELVFDRNVEAAIFRTVPHTIKPHKNFKVPAAVVIGSGSDIMGKANARLMHKSLGMKVRWINGGHLFPFEKPEETAHLIQELLKDMPL